MMNTYWGRSIAAPSIPASEVRYVNSMGKLVGQSRTNRYLPGAVQSRHNTGAVQTHAVQSYGGQQGYAIMDTHGASLQDTTSVQDCEAEVAAMGLQDGHTYEDQPGDPEEHAAFGNEHGEPQDGDTCDVEADRILGTSAHRSRGDRMVRILPSPEEQWHHVDRPHPLLHTQERDRQRE